MEKHKSEADAVKIIQRSFRKYLSQKHKLENLEASSKFEKFRTEDSNKKNVKYSEEVWKVKNSLESFYKKVVQNSDRYKYVNDLIIETDKSTNKLKYFKSLDSLESTKIPKDPEIYNEAKRKHEEKLRELRLPWWEKLDLHDNNNYVE